MNYRRIYDAFIADRLAKCPGKEKQLHMERHHVIPRCMDGGDHDNNLVCLTYSDHIFAHLLLAKIYGGKLAIAFQKMTTVKRYRGRHTRLAHAVLMAEARKAKGQSMKGKKQSAKHAASLKRYNESRRGQPASPAQIAHMRRLAVLRIGKPAHPNAIVAVSRSGEDRTLAQIERNNRIAEKRRGKPPHPNTLAAAIKLGDKLRGNPWPEARRLAQNAKMAMRPQIGE